MRISPHHPLLPLALAAVSACALDDSLETDVSEVIVVDHRDPSTGGGAYTLVTTPVFEQAYSLTAGASYTFSTRNTSVGADPVLHVLENGVEVARDDDLGGNLDARVNFRPSRSGSYTVLIRAAWNGRGGTTDLYSGATRLVTGLRFEGTYRRLEGLRARETLTTLPLPTGPTSHRLYLFDDNGRMTSRVASGASQGASVEVSSGLVDRSLLAAAPAGPVRLVRNDAAVRVFDAPLPDDDADGLGNELEAQIGTCSRLSGLAGGFDCARALDPRDSDGDGLGDAIEVLGKTASTPYQLLPRWGADPRHKDLFLEIDFRVRKRGETDERMQPAEVIKMAAALADVETDYVVRTRNANTLRNPDGLPGIRLHADTGVSPGSGAPASDHATYGDWGGHNAVAPISCDADGECKGADEQVAWTTQMHANRRGIFRYALSYGSGGASSASHSIAASFNHSSGINGAHELTHTLGVGHSGPSYAEGDIDPNCKPNYPSLMNYAYYDDKYLGFSNGMGRSILNNTRLQEQGAVPNPTSLGGRRYLADLQNVYEYHVTSGGNVDWNRDGQFSSNPVRAYAGWRPGGQGCEFTKYNTIKLGGRSFQAPAISRAQGQIFTAYLDAAGSIRIESTPDPLTCATLEPTGCDRTMTRWPAWGSGIQAFDTHRIVLGGSQRLLVVYRDSTSRLRETIFTPTGGGTWSTPVALPPLTGPAGVMATEGVSLTGTDLDVWLAFRDSDGRVRFPRRNSGVWSASSYALDPAGAQLPVVPAGTSPALLEAGGTLYGAFPTDHVDETEKGRVRLYTFDPARWRWSASTWLTETSPTVGKPAMAWVPFVPVVGLAGRLHLMVSTRANGTAIEWKLTRKPVDGVVEVRMYAAPHQNSSYGALGFDYLYEPGRDSNLRALVTRESGDEPTGGVVELRPQADGILDWDLRDWNDWEVMRVDLCEVLVATAPRPIVPVGTPVAEPIRCPAWIW